MKAWGGGPGCGANRKPGLWCVILLGLSLLPATQGKAQEISDSLRVRTRGVSDSPRARVRDVSDSLQVAAPVVAAPPDSIPTSSGHGLNAPFWIMMRSLVVPGLGQLSNGKYPKAAVVAAGEGYMIYRIIHHERERRRFKDKAEEFPEQAFFYEAKADAEAERRKDFSWWTALAVAVSMADAFVDAQLRYFNTEFNARDAGEDEPTVEFKVGLRLEW